jgi:hypothetical protein
MVRAGLELDHCATRLDAGEAEADELGDRGRGASPRRAILMNSSTFGMVTLPSGTRPFARPQLQFTLE